MLVQKASFPAILKNSMEFFFYFNSQYPRISDFSQRTKSLVPYYFKPLERDIDAVGVLCVSDGLSC